MTADTLLMEQDARLSGWREPLKRFGIAVREISCRLMVDAFAAS